MKDKNVLFNVYQEIKDRRKYVRESSKDKENGGHANKIKGMN